MSFKQLKKLNQILTLSKQYQWLVGIALVLSFSLICSQRLFNSSLQNTLNNQSSSLLTADIEIASTRALSTPNIKIIESILPDQRRSMRQIFSSMIQFYGQQTRIAEVVVIDDHYPLKGNARAINQNGNIKSVSELLKDYPKGIVVSEELSDSTDITYQSTIKIGNLATKVVGIISEEPDVNIQSLALGPRVYIHQSNLVNLGFNETMSKKYHSLFFELKNKGDILKITKQLEASLNVEGDRKTIQGSYGPSQPIVVRNFRDINRDIIRSFDALNQFYFFLSIFILLLSGTAFGFIIWSSIIQKLPEIGNLRYLGCSIKEIQKHYLKASSKIGVIVTGTGFILGAIFAQLALTIVSRQINIEFQWVHINFSDTLFLISFSFISIIGITQIILNIIHANRLFHHEQNAPTIKKAIIKIGLGLICFLILFLISNRIPIKTALLITALFLGIFSILYGVDLMVSYGLKKLSLRHIEFKLAIKYLSQGHTLRRMAFIAITFSLITIGCIAHYEAALNNEFNPKNSHKVLPDLFVLDIYDTQLKSFKSVAGENAHFGALINSRIKKINQLNLNDYIDQRDLEESYFLFREQNLSTRKSLYKSEKLTEGKWFNPSDNIIEMSIEKRFAQRLALQLGDNIEFSFFGLPFSATVTSIRTVDWSTYKPNFFMIIEPPYLNQIPKTWISSIKTPQSKKKHILKAELSKEFPNITVIDIEKTSKKIIGFLKSIVLAINIGAYYCFIIGLVLFLLLGKLFSEIRRENTIQLYWLGMAKKNISKISLIEELCFTNIIFIVGTLISLLITFILFNVFIPLDLKFNVQSILIIFITLNSLVCLNHKYNPPKIKVGDTLV
ncbi:MAG: FtsX-like permease family protein [Candidatus Margulisiibacteriota bacterium]